VSEGVAQAKLYAQKLNLETTYSTNGNEIYQICLKTGEEKRVEDFGLKVEFLSIQLGLRHTFTHCQFITFRLNDCQLNALINQNIISN
jgi:hypothetical protein